MTEAVLSALHELIAVTRGQRNDAWLRLEGIADHIDMSSDHVAKRIVTHPTFPKPARANGTGHARWLRSEVDAWMRSQQ